MFIVLYGINNLGKSTQATMLTARMNEEGYHAQYLKYPIYDLPESGPMINEYLRGGNPFSLSPRELQLLHAVNKTQAEPALKKKLKSGTHVVAEDYVLTSIAWGMGAGVDETFLTTLNAHLITPDLVCIFQGTRFTESTEQNHKHETDDALLDRVADAFSHLSQKYPCILIDANRPIETIHEELWSHVKSHLSKPPHSS